MTVKRNILEIYWDGRGSQLFGWVEKLTVIKDNFLACDLRNLVNGDIITLEKQVWD